MAKQLDIEEELSNLPKNFDNSFFIRDMIMANFDRMIKQHLVDIKIAIEDELEKRYKETSRGKQNESIGTDKNGN